MSDEPLQNHPQYRVQRRLGLGGFSTVWLAWDQKRSIPVAIKVFSMKDHDGVLFFRKEYEKTKQLSHPNVIKLLDFEEDADGAYIIMPYYKRGNIQDRIGEMTEEEVWRLIRDVGRALAYIHAQKPPFLHNDLKPDNFLISDDGRFILSDFGIGLELDNHLLSTNNPDQNDRAIIGRGPSAYKAPECFSYRNQIGDTPFMASEIWAFGACLYQLTTGETPFLDRGGQVQLEEYIDSGQDAEQLLKPLPPEFSSSLSHLVMKCLSYHPWVRPRADELVKMAEKQLNLIYNNVRIKPVDSPNIALETSWINIRWGMSLLGALLLGAGLTYFLLSGNKKTADKPKKETPVNTEPNPPKLIKEKSKPVSESSDIGNLPVKREIDPSNDIITTSNIADNEKKAKNENDMNKVVNRYLGDTSNYVLERKNNAPELPAKQKNPKNKSDIFGSLFGDKPRYGASIAVFTASKRAIQYVDSLGLKECYVIKSSELNYYVIKPFNSKEEAVNYCNKNRKKNCTLVKYNLGKNQKGYYLGKVNKISDLPEKIE